jgi:hypothetical protein
MNAGPRENRSSLFAASFTDHLQIGYPLIKEFPGKLLFVSITDQSVLIPLPHIGKNGVGDIGDHQLRKGYREAPLIKSNTK